MQFSAIPYNLLGKRTKANYITTGLWSSQAIKEGAKLCQAVEVWPQGEKPRYNTLPDFNKWKVEKRDAAYFHYCDNETVHGVEFQAEAFPYDDII